MNSSDHHWYWSSSCRSPHDGSARISKSDNSFKRAQKSLSRPPSLQWYSSPAKPQFLRLTPFPAQLLGFTAFRGSSALTSTYASRLIRSSTSCILYVTWIQKVTTRRMIPPASTAPTTTLSLPLLLQCRLWKDVPTISFHGNRMSCGRCWETMA